MVTYEQFYNIYLETRKNKRRSDDSITFEVDFENNLRHIVDDINNRQLKIEGAYTFIAQNPGRNGYREVFAADLKDRVIHHYIHSSLIEIMERTWIPNTFNNRKKKGVLAAVESIREGIKQESNNYRDECFIIKWDLSAFFMTIKHDIMWNKLKQIINAEYHKDDKEDLLYVIYECIYSDPTSNCVRKSPVRKWDLVEARKSLFNQPPGQGAAIGFLIWQMFVNFYHNEIDHWISNELGLKFYRFVDDMCIVTRNKKFVLKVVMRELRKRYKDINVTIQNKKFYCQSYTKGVKFCGYTIHFNRFYPNDRTVNSLRRVVYKYNKITDYFGTYTNLISSLNSYLGLFKHCFAVKRVNKEIDKLDKRWYHFIDFDSKRRVFKAKYWCNHVNRLNIIYRMRLPCIKEKFRYDKCYAKYPVFNKSFSKVIKYKTDIPIIENKLIFNLDHPYNILAQTTKRFWDEYIKYHSMFIRSKWYKCKNSSKFQDDFIKQRIVTLEVMEKLYI